MKENLYQRKDEWYRSILHGIKASTSANYTFKTDKHLLPWFENRKITEITQDFVYSFIQEKQNARLSNRYITDILVLMKAVFKYISH